MNFSASARAHQTVRRAIANSFADVRPNWLHTTTQLALAAAVFLFAQVPHSIQLDGQVAPHSSAAISRDTHSKGNRAERAAARDAKKKARATRTSHSDDASLAKAKSGKKSSNSSVNLGDDDPLGGL